MTRLPSFLGEERLQLGKHENKENFPVLNDLLGPVEPEISRFLFTPVFFEQIEMALSDRSQQQNVS